MKLRLPRACGEAPLRPGQGTAARSAGWNWPIAVLTILLASVLLLGCTSSAQTRRALEAYRNRQYAEALREGEAAARVSQPPERDRAALVAGMSAYQLRKYPEAERWLRPLTSSEDREVAGRAYATLGLVSVAMERYPAAALDLSAAARRLTGDESARAWYFAGECYSIAGRIDQSRRAYESARAAVRTQAMRAKIDSRLGATACTLQIGAFASRTNAEKAASASAGRASSLGLSAPVVVAIPDATGRTIYLVHAGRFTSRTEAMAARARFGTDAIVVPAR